MVSAHGDSGAALPESAEEELLDLSRRAGALWDSLLGKVWSALLIVLAHTLGVGVRFLLWLFEGATGGWFGFAVLNAARFGTLLGVVVGSNWAGWWHLDWIHTGWVPGSFSGSVW